MSLAPPTLVNAIVPVVRPHPEKQILWPTFTGYGDNGGSDSQTFPSLSAIKARQAARSPEALAAFVEAARAAQDRILILDDFLFKPQEGQSQRDRYDQILLWLPLDLVASDIRFLTKAHKEENVIRELFDEHAEQMNQRVSRRGSVMKIEIGFSLGKEFPYVHDRFAIIDNELWHFGATVGGLHSLVNAATRGWNAEAHQAIRFFNDAWVGDGDARRGGRHG